MESRGLGIFFPKMIQKMRRWRNGGESAYRIPTLVSGLHCSGPISGLLLQKPIGQPDHRAIRAFEPLHFCKKGTSTIWLTGTFGFSTET